MATPDFILNLRQHIGHDVLWMAGVTGYIVNDRNEVLLERRADNGKWALVSGIVEPGEQPADTLIREAKEEAGIDVVVTDLVDVQSDTNELVYPNGDRAMYMDHLFFAHVNPDGLTEPFVADEESLSVAWCSRDELPSPLTASSVARMALVDEYLSRKAAGDSRALFSSQLQELS